MLEINKNVTDILRKIRVYLEDGKMSMEQFPLDSILEIVENTLGPAVWNCIGSTENEAFQKVPELYKEWFEEIVQKNDTKGCIRLLELFENSYKCLYTGIGASERDFREGPYRRMIMENGSAYAKVQYRLHESRQQGKTKPEKKLVSGKGVIYTCVKGEDVLPYQPAEINEELDYICFTDDERKWGSIIGVWSFRKPIEEEDLELAEDIFCAKYRILGPTLLQEYDYSVWLHPSIQAVGNVVQFCRAYGNGYSFLSFSAPSDDCVYNDEKKLSMSTDNISIGIRKGLYKYRTEGFPEHYGLIDGHVIARNHKDSELIAVMEDWWQEVEQYKGFGDSCFNYVAWKHDFTFAICDLFAYYNVYFKNMDVDLEIYGDLS